MTAASYQRVIGANDRVGVGVIGCGERGLGLMAYLPQVGGTEIRAVADVYVPRRERAIARAGSATGAFSDYRRVIDAKGIDAVLICTPDHWHVPMTCEAVAAGKDVYVEKPVSHSLDEGATLLEAVESSGRVVATGTQQRSWDHFLEARQLVAEGLLGRITFVRCHWFQNHLHAGAERAPEIDFRLLDWDRWLGPAPDQPFDKIRFHYWRFFWDFGGGSVTDLMTHWIDTIQWFMNSPKASRISAAGATHVQNWFDAPDTLTATLLFPEGYTAVYESSLVFGLQGCGIEFHGDKALMTLDRQGYAVYQEGTMPFEAPGLPEPVRCFEGRGVSSCSAQMDGTGTADNLRNWLDCVRSRKTPNAHVRAGVEAANTAHRVNELLRRKRVS